MTKRRKLVLCGLAIFILIVIPLGIAGELWFGPTGTGEVRRSPDGKYEASAENLSTGNPRGGRDHYLQVRVIELSTDNVVWQIVHNHAPAANVPEYGMRGVKFVVWAEDSTSVTVPVANGQELKLVVP